MQTFLPSLGFHDSARCLDNKRLGKQRVEVLQLLKGQFPNHPAAKMWRGYEGALAMYGLIVCDVWKERGFKDTCFDKIAALLSVHKWPYQAPPWLGDTEFHYRHRCRLFDKDPTFYKKFAYERPRLAYLWPVLSEDGKTYTLKEI